ncbi:MAG TPA: hypothetical protein PLR88_11090 [Bacteroidales bacterium]|nr:hypothetical protein [Bacteroidales bacterium]
MLLKFLSLYHIRFFALFAICFSAGMNANGQNLIGYSAKEIKKYMTGNCRDMSSEKVVNGKYKYLKYTSDSETQTLLFFIDKDSICKNVRLICSKMLKAEKMKELDSIYEKNGDNRWIDKRNGREYLVRLTDEEFSFVITIEPDK